MPLVQTNIDLALMLFADNLLRELFSDGALIAVGAVQTQQKVNPKLTWQLQYNTDVDEVHKIV